MKITVQHEDYRLVDTGDVNNQLGQLENARFSDGTESAQSSHACPCGKVYILQIRITVRALPYTLPHSSSTVFHDVEGIEYLEMLGFKVFALTGDGTSTKYIILKMHSDGSGVPCCKRCSILSR